MRSQMSDVRRGDRHMKRKPMRAALWLLPLSSTFGFSQTSVNVLINRDDMGKYRSAADQVLQSLPGACERRIRCVRYPRVFQPDCVLLRISRFREGILIGKWSL